MPVAQSTFDTVLGSGDGSDIGEIGQMQEAHGAP